MTPGGHFQNQDSLLRIRDIIIPTVVKHQRSFCRSVAAFHHGGNGDHADGRAGGDAGTGNGSEEGTCNDRGHGQAAGTAPYHHVGKADKLTGKPALTHKDTGQHKEENVKEKKEKSKEKWKN